MRRFFSKKQQLSLLLSLLFAIFIAFKTDSPKTSPKPQGSTEKTVQSIDQDDQIEEETLSNEMSQEPLITKTVQGATTQKETTSEQAKQEAFVQKVVDGDTIHVVLNGESKTIRIIGINTPETVDPRKPVQCFGKEASKRAKDLLLNKTVFLESDPTQGEFDKYQRLLRFVWLDSNVDFGQKMITEGFAYEYTYNLPYKYQSIYKEAEREAQTGKRGLWSETTNCAN